MARKHRQDIVSWYERPQEDPCPLCGRPIPGDQRDDHHLVPKCRGGRETLTLHRVCHRQIHALFSEVELERLYPTIEALRAHPQIDKFVTWVRRKPPGFYDASKRSNRRSK